MFMIMSHLQGKPGHCPRPDCTGVGMTEYDASGQVTWYVSIECDTRQS